MRALVYAKLKKVRSLQGSKLNIIFQGGYDFDIVGDLENFEIDETSHLKSNCFIECSGGVKIGRYFHCGRGLTIFSSNHNFKNPTRIPYDTADIKKPVVIKDFVWLGANVTIIPGVTIGEGAVIGAGTVVNKDIADHSIVVSAGCRVIGARDSTKFNKLKEKHLFQM